jgi:hypothetical protein
MEVFPDFKELLELLNDHHVEYAIVGAYALAHYGAPRFTSDLDIFVKPGIDNARRVVQALNEFGVAALEFKENDFTEPDSIIQIGVAPIRIDIMTSLDGVSWEDVAGNREPGLFGDINVFYIGKEQFILNKRAIGRKKDLADLDALGGM